MSHNLQKLEELAAECERRAKSIEDPQMKAVFMEMAVGWRELARLRERLEDDRSFAKSPKRDG